MSGGTQQHIHGLAMWIYGKLMLSSGLWVRDGYIKNSCEFYREKVSLDDISAALQYLDGADLISVYEQSGNKYYRARNTQDIALGIHQLRVWKNRGMLIAGTF